MECCVLIVDDEPTVRTVLTEMLSEFPFQTFEAETASEALKVLRKVGPQIGILITDVKMPGILDGLDLAKFAQNSWPWIKIIVTTGFADSVQQGLPDNLRFLPKPWTVQEMTSCILDASQEFVPFRR